MTKITNPRSIVQFVVSAVVGGAIIIGWSLWLYSEARTQGVLPTNDNGVEWLAVKTFLLIALSIWLLDCWLGKHKAPIDVMLDGVFLRSMIVAILPLLVMEFTFGAARAGGHIIAYVQKPMQIAAAADGRAASKICAAKKLRFVSVTPAHLGASSFYPFFFSRENVPNPVAHCADRDGVLHDFAYEGKQ